MLDLWYKNALIYSLDVKSFKDSNGDGIGDFRGLADRLDHIEALGVTCLWLLPFYPSPNRDNGYDITDFYGIDPRLGTLGDFVVFAREASSRGLRVLVDLVVNHTSTDHPWFQSARSDPNSPYRDWYVWSKEKPEQLAEGVVFPGVQEAIWSYDQVAKAWYLHRFYEHQADLNIANPEVREEIDRIMGFWLQLGVSGFRVDAVPFLIEHFGLAEPPQQKPELYLGEMRRFLSWRSAGSVLLAEANLPMEEAVSYFRAGEEGEDRMHLVFNFPLNQSLFLALARRNADPIRDALHAAPDLPLEAQWGTFLRNHDELDLGRLTPEERDEVYAAMAPDPSMTLYERGVRRRLAPMLGADLRRLRLAYSLLFALPGAPVLWYGEEIGMGENLELREREAVRTPMQWVKGPSGGFSVVPPERLVRRPPDGAFGPDRVNVRAQMGEPESLMNFIRSLVSARRGAPAIGWGKWRLLDTDSRVLGLCSDWRGDFVMTLHNLSEETVDVRPSIDDLDSDRRLDVIFAANGAEPPGADGQLSLPPSGTIWLQPERD